MIQRERTSDRHILWVLLVGVPAVVFFTLQANADVNPILVSPEQHFYVVSVASVVCFALAVVAVRASLALQSARVSLMALGFLVMSGLFAVHGLTTPGYLVDARYYVATGFSARMSIFSGAMLLALSAAPLPAGFAQAVNAFRYHIFSLTAAGIAGFAVVSLTYPEAIPPSVMTAAWFLDGSTYGVFAFAGFAAVAYTALYLKTGMPVYGAVAVGAALMIEAQIGVQWGELWRWSWWMYHLQLLGAFVAMLAFPFASRAATGGSVENAADAIVRDEAA